MGNNTDFYLTSTEIRPTLIPRYCRTIQSLWSEERQGYFLCIGVEPSINGRFFNIINDEINELVVATRYSGVSLFPMSNFPVTVYACLILNTEIRISGTVSRKDLQVLFIGELYRNLEDAERAISFEPLRI